MSDFHLLIYLTTMDALPLKETMKPLLEAIKTRNTAMANEWARSDQWLTIEQLMLANSSAPSTSSSHAATADMSSSTVASAMEGPKWSCSYCTFENDGNKSTCEMCSLPKET
ncbi:unnamed protein product [Medioppia subpectinata]|uniref:RanBP2-type domain-containing protein n=1 Tax=Medioppia subpectinata TaxID=1979941 RepID=A0A7R9LX64_9ACAR|nr:unnamed protein product [Medioppia subpectinata]CAG2122491.1 unnamed protein product [Medioppia subpectinata]